MSHSELEQKLVAREIQPTAVRILVLEQLTQSRSALSLAELETHLDTVERSTIFRTLKTFEKNKLAHSIEDGSGSIKYAICEDTCDCLPEQKHIHFHCNQCQNTFCITEIQFPPINLPKNFVGQEVDLIVKGLCDQCS